MERASLDFWENYLETMLIFKHTVKHAGKSLTICAFVQIQSVTDRQTDGRTDLPQMSRSNADAL